jgi:D-alanyl-D-alanine carboxypeptidase
MRLAPALLAVFVAPLAAQQLSTAERARIDSAATAVLTATGAPGASVAIVRGGEIVYERGFGDGRINPSVPTTTAMRYSIGSVSKQFTATAILMLAEDGKLSLDDKVAKWFPALTRANEISIRQLLSMTAGYQDYWPQDYVFTDMQKPTTAAAIMQRWAGKALDFDPGTKWQYSNTNYVIAGAIVEKASGQPLMTFLKQRIFAPLHMSSVADVDAGPLGAADAQPLMRNAVGPLRVAPKEAAGWLMSAGELGMTPHDLALWDIAVMNRTLLKSASYRQQQSVLILENGLATNYGLGVSLGNAFGRKRVTHGGAVSGYTTTNDIYPDDKTAVVVITNIYPGAAGAPGQIAARIGGILFTQVNEAADKAREQARAIFNGLTKGEITRSLFTADCNAYFSAEVLSDYAASLGSLGAPSEFTSTGESLRGGMTIRSYRIRAGSLVLSLTTMTQPSGLIDQYLIERAG